jgi:hypothetical protein
MRLIWESEDLMRVIEKNPLPTTTKRLARITGLPNWKTKDLLDKLREESLILMERYRCGYTTWYCLYGTGDQHRELMRLFNDGPNPYTAYASRKDKVLDSLRGEVIE